MLPDLSSFKDGENILCLHGVSAGEVASFYSFALLARGRYRLLITTSTSSGMEMAQKLYSKDLLAYFPYDCPFSVMRFLSFFKPRLICFAEGEFWPFMLWYAYRKRIPTFLINGRISSKDLSRYGLLGPVFRKLFNYHKLLCLQSAEDYDKFCDFGIRSNKLNITGNLKFDLNIETSAIKVRFTKDRLIIILASSHSGEEKIVLDVFSRLYKLFPNISLIIAPRHTNRAMELSKLIQSYSFKSIMFSNIRYEFGEFCFSDGDILVLDTMGDLLSLYRYSDMVILGGSFVKGFGGHNPIEPAYFGKPIVIGAYYYNIVSIVRYFRVADAIILCCDKLSSTAFEDCIREELFISLRRLISDIPFRERLGRNARFVVDTARGSSRKTFDMIRQNVNIV